MSRPTYSFEYFPPKSAEAEEDLFEAMGELATLNPSYMTVTYGAGGTTKDGTRKTLHRALQAYGIPMASHLTYLSTTKDVLDEYIDSLWNSGIKHIVALRGDLPKGASFDDFKGDDYHRFTSEFVEHILKRHPFEISVAAYPEKHPDAPSMKADIEALKKKCDAGATRAITQFFFDNHVYYDFVEKARAAGITTPIVPGVLPIHDLVGTRKFAARCGASVPEWLIAEFQGFELKPDEMKKIATEILTEQVLDLAANGVQHIHLYTLNRADITREACQALNK